MADFDAIVVGSGMSGGWVAKELCERGLKVCVVERGRAITPESDYTDMLDPWEIEHLGWDDRSAQRDYPLQSSNYSFRNYTKQFWVKDAEHPFETEEGTRFHWRRGHHVGGRSLMWARQSYRMSEIDFAANASDGHGTDWPVRYADIAPWYDRAETFAGVSGDNDDDVEVLPHGGVFQPAHQMTALEMHWKDAIEARWPTRTMIIGRTANLTQPTAEQTALGRGQCQARDHCSRGCSYGAYFSANSATLPAAERTGNLTLLTDTAVHAVDYDPTTQRASGIRGVDTATMEPISLSARLVFLNASAVASAAILLNSGDADRPNGLANSSGHVGHNLIGHCGSGRASGRHDGFMDSHHFGRRPNGIYIPRFRNHTEDGDGYLRGYGFQGRAYRGGWQGREGGAGVGAAFKDAIRAPGPWRLSLSSFGETLPRFENHVRLHPTKTDKWGFPIPVFDCRLTENELAMTRQAARDAEAMLRVAGARDVRSNAETLTLDTMRAPGDSIHEMGTCRMGRDPSTSVLNGWNQTHDVANLFVTDGSFMASSACQNPSLTYMAFSARAANHAADLMQEGAL